MVQVANASTEVCGKAQPAQVRDLTPASDGVDGAPNISQIPVNTNKSNYINRRCNGAVETKEEGGPNEIESKLDRVECHGLPGRPDGLRGRERREAIECRTICSVTHYTRAMDLWSARKDRAHIGCARRSPIEDGPDRAEEPWRRV